MKIYRIMNIRITTLGIVVVFCLNYLMTVGQTQKLEDIYWEMLNEEQKSEVLKYNKVNISVCELYNGNFVLKSDKGTLLLLDTLITLNQKIAPLYFHLFNKVCNEADGDISEILGQYCQKIILKYPEYVFTYLSKNKMLLDKYAEYLGYELYFKEEGTSMIEYSYEEFKMKLSESLKDEDKFSETLVVFYKEIENMMKNMD